MINFPVYVVRDGSGNVDVKKTKAKFTAELDAFVLSQATGDSAIEKAIHAAFDSVADDGTINTLALVSIVASGLSLNHEFTKVQKRVKAHLDQSADFVLIRGQSGGWQRKHKLTVVTETVETIPLDTLDSVAAE